LRRSADVHLGGLDGDPGALVLRLDQVVRRLGIVFDCRSDLIRSLLQLVASYSIFAPATAA